MRFEPYDRLQATGHTVDRANYELIYTAPLAPGTSLEDIYTRFNIDHPKDFKGHSLSVSDVVVLHQNGQDAAHYVDSFGYKEVPEFLQEQTQQPEKINPLKHVEDTIEQNDNNFDGIINNTPTVDELEAKVKELNEKYPKTMPLKISSSSGFIHIDQDTKTHNNGCDKPVAYFFIYRVKRIYRFSERPQIEQKGGTK